MPPARRVVVGTSGFSYADWRGDFYPKKLPAEVDPEEGSGAPYVRTARFTYVRLRKSGYDGAGLAATFRRIRLLARASAAQLPHRA